MRSLALILFLFAGLQAYAQLGKMDLNTHDLVIEKLEGVIKNLDKKIEQKVPIILRVADLYADRSRMKFIAEVEKKCEGCLGSKSDRKAAIAHYMTIIDHVEGDTQAQALIQAAHLHKLLGETKKALDLYTSVAFSNKRYSPLLRGTALGGVGEMQFQMGDFKKAKANIEKALNIAETPQKGFLMYRLAWCQLNLGETARATNTMVNLLRNSELLQLKSTASGANASSFHEDVSRDFATFLAKGNVGQKEINLLIDLSPQTVQRSNLFFLGEETDRLGQKNGSLTVWRNYVALGKLTTQEELEIQIRVAQLNYDLGRLADATTEYDKAISAWKKRGCNGDVCNELRIRLRNFVTVWNKAKKKTPDLALLKAYKSYLSVFNEDVEMMYWAGDVARQINRPAEAMELYLNTSVLAANQLKKKSDDPVTRKIFEGSLLAQIEMAEATKSLELRRKAYNHYLSLNPKGQKSLEVRYQLARLLYEEKKYIEASRAFTVIAEEKDEKQRNLRIKAADLALDSLAVVKRDDLIETQAEELSQLLPERKTEYLNLQKKARLNLVAAVLKNPNSSQGELREAQKRLAAIKVSTLTKDEKIAYYKNQMILGEAIKDLSLVDQSSKELLKIRGLGQNDERLALQYQLWVAEMRLEFSQAYRLSQRVNLKAVSTEQALLKQAIFAELAGQPSDGLYREYIKKSSSRREANIIRAKLIRQQANMWTGIESDMGALAKTPDIMAVLALEAYSKKPNRKQAEKILKNRSLQNHPEGRALARIVFMEEFNQFEKKIARHQIRSGSDAALQRTLNERIKLLNESEVWANQAVKSTDWSLQLLTLHRVATENKKLHRELLALPVPASLRGAQRAEYQKVLQVQAKPFVDKASQVEDKIDELWSNSAAVERIESDYKNADYNVSKIFAQELKNVASVATPSQRQRILSSLNERDRKPSHGEISQARTKVSRDPFNKGLIQQLRELELKAGGQTMVTYLDARLHSLQESRQ